MDNIYLSIGSNCGDKEENIDCAISDIRKIDNVYIKSVSSKYLTEPHNIDTGNWFINCAIKVETILEPELLLKKLSAVENRYARNWERKSGDDRTIDIDILLYENEIIKIELLKIPHPKMCERRFVLTPLAEIAPDIVHPVKRKTISCLLDECKDSNKVIRK